MKFAQFLLFFCLATLLIVPFATATHIDESASVFGGSYVFSFFRNIITGLQIDENNEAVYYMGCVNNIDDDGDGYKDCRDPDCDGEYKCEYGQELTCDDMWDNDADYMFDCGDPDCGGKNNCEYGHELTCDDSFDNDYDVYFDCGDPDCNGKNNCEYGTEVTCDDNFDNDFDALYDCDDSDCTFNLECKDCDGDDCGDDASGEICNDGEDNDYDGNVDCDDSDCFAYPGCAENCDNGIDDNDNGLVDCDDINYCNCEPPPGGGEICDNWFDDDGDGLVDCHDPHCQGDGSASDSCKDHEICDNGVDDSNPTDYLVDCHDPDCYDKYGGHPLCQNVEICDDGIDNDQNDKTDCADLSCNCWKDVCHAHPTCKEYYCMDTVDNDNDGMIDCIDADCNNDPFCGGGGDDDDEDVEICDDGIDNDGDFQIDCKDPDCFLDPICDGKDNNVEYCDNGIDDDGDFLVDCDDKDDCSYHSKCYPYGDDGGDEDENFKDGYASFDEHWLNCDGCSYTEGSCDDGDDYDMDGLTDCQDPDCKNDPLCKNYDYTNLEFTGKPPVLTEERQNSLLVGLGKIGNDLRTTADEVRALAEHNEKTGDQVIGQDYRRALAMISHTAGIITRINYDVNAIGDPTNIDAVIVRDTVREQQESIRIIRDLLIETFSKTNVQENIDSFNTPSA